MTKGNKRIIVLGGSFNPPTIAHYRLMKEAVDALCADIGFFVPVSDAYLKRKMRHSHPPVVLSPELRIKMLQTMCADDSRFHLCEKEMSIYGADTIGTMKALQEVYPNAEQYFLMGADKLDLLAHMTKKWGFLDAFKVVLYSRGDDSLEQILKGNEVLSAYVDRIVILPQPNGTEGVSSSLVRERMLNGESSQDLLCPGVWELFKTFTPTDFPDVINMFKGEYDFLSNRFPCQVLWEGQQYPSAESVFQASKCAVETEREVFTRCSIHKATVKGIVLNPSSEWEDARLDIMKSIIKAKFEQNPNLMQKLVDTGNRILINGNNKQETFWGVDLYSWEGENQLGKIIMEIREKEKSK